MKIITYYHVPLYFAFWIVCFRPELPFEGLEKLTAAIKKDITDSVTLADESDATTQDEQEWVKTSSDIE